MTEHVGGLAPDTLKFLIPPSTGAAPSPEPGAGAPGGALADSPAGRDVPGLGAYQGSFGEAARGAACPEAGLRWPLPWPAGRSGAQGGEVAGAGALHSVMSSPR